jgi:hypothetical protein
MSLSAKRILAAILAVSAIGVGGWAAASPRTFYADFPMPGRHWVSLLGPYNEHLIRDVGGLYLALFVLTLYAALRPADQLLRFTGLAWVVFGLQHFAYHLFHLAMFPMIDQVTMMLSLGAVAVLGALIMLPEGRWSSR